MERRWVERLRVGEDSRVLEFGVDQGLSAVVRAAR